MRFEKVFDICISHKSCKKKSYTRKKSTNLCNLSNLRVNLSSAKQEGKLAMHTCWCKSQKFGSKRICSFQNCKLISPLNIALIWINCYWKCLVYNPTVIFLSYILTCNNFKQDTWQFQKYASSIWNQETPTGHVS